MNKYLFNNTLIIGIGLIGSSIAIGLRKNKISNKIFGFDINKKHIKKSKKLKIIDKDIKNLSKIKNIDLIVICSPVGTYDNIFKKILPNINKKCIVSDVGSTKLNLINLFEKYNNKNLSNFVPCHPIAGIEKSGPEYGFAELFKNRYCILTPTKPRSIATKKISKMWKKLGMKIEIMDAERHDRLLAMISHIPQLIAYSVVSTTKDLEKNLKYDLIKLSAGGFRDFTRLAGSDPIMWRDIYSENKKFVLEMLSRFSEDLLTLQKAIRNNNLKFLEKTFVETKKIRAKIEKQGQAGFFDPREKK